MNINEIASDFQILGHSIKCFNIVNEFVYLDPADSSVSREFNVSYELSEPFDNDSDKEAICGAVTLFIDVTISNEENTSSVHLELEGGFMLKNCRESEKLNEMLAVNGCAALYSIGRGIISGVTSQMSIDGTGTIMLPMINTFELRTVQNAGQMET